MSRFVRVSVVSLCVLAAVSSVYGDFVETFDQGTQDWQAWEINNGGRVRQQAPEWNESSRAGGYASADVRRGGWRLYGMQPATADAYGDLTGGTLSLDFLLEGSVESRGGSPTVRFYVGANDGGRNDYFVSSDLVSWNPNHDTGWTNHTIALTSSNFIEWPNQAAHSRTFEQVLADADDIGLVFTGGMDSFRSSRKLGFSSRRGATLSVDNFSVVTSPSVPEPGTCAVMALGGLGFVLRRRRRAAAQ